MEPSTFHFRVFLIFMWASALLYCADGASIPDKTLTMADLNRELRREYEAFYTYHVFSILVVTSYDDHFYNITDERISPECMATIKVAVTLKMQLTLGNEMNNVLISAVTDSRRDFRKDKESKHALEFVCQKLEKAIAEKPALSQAREKASKNLLPGFSKGGRPSYSQKLFTKREAVAVFMLRKMNVPDLARYFCDEEVQNQLDESTAYSNRTHLFVKSIVATAEKEKFGQTLQSMYEKSLDEIVPRISANVNLDTLLLSDEKTFWFLPEFLKIFYNNLVKDVVLKKEVEDAAAILGKDADKTDLDFSKI